MKTLFVFLDKPFRYCILHQENTGSVSVSDLNSTQEPEEIIKVREGCDYAIGIIPGEQVSVYSVEYPVNSYKKAKQITPFLLEDHLVSNVEDLEFLLLNWGANKKKTVAILAKSTWAEYKELAVETAFNLNELIPDYDLINLTQDHSACLFHDINTNRVLIKQRKENLIEGLVLNRQELDFWFEEFDKEQARLLSHDDTVAKELAIIDSLKAEIFHDSITSFPELIVNRSNAGSQPDLLLYKASHTDSLIQKVKPWLIASAAMLMLTVLTALFYDVYKYWIYSSQNKELDNRIALIFEENFPDEVVVAGVEREQFDQKIKALQGGARGTQEFLFLLDQVSRVMPKNNITLVELHFHDSLLDLIFKVDNFAILDDFTKRINADFIDIKQLSSDSQDGKVTAKYQFKVRS